MTRKNSWWTSCSSIDDVRTSSRFHRVLLGTLELSLDLCGPFGQTYVFLGGNIRVSANYKFSQFGVTQDLAVPALASWPELLLKFGCESGHLQQGRMVYRLVCLI